MKIQTIFLDVDEVLANWVDATSTLLGLCPADVRAHWDTLTPRPWDLFEVIPHSADQAWRAIDHEGAAFWADLDPYPWMSELYAECVGVAPTVLLTSPSLHHSSHAGKVQWIQHHFGRHFRDYLIGTCKHRVAHPGAVLIDDSPKNCDAFRKHGGRVLLFPGIGNELNSIPADRRVEFVVTRLSGLEVQP